MQTTLTWENPNQLPVIVKIYRGTSELQRGALGTALVTLTEGQTSWVDTTAAAGVQYYYVYEIISATNPLEKITSRNFKTMDGKQRGPGPQTLVVGTLELGYYGTVVSSDFFSREYLLNQYSLGVRAAATTEQVNVWHKFVRNNKVLYVPDLPIGFNITWLDLYSAGLVFGYDGDGKGDPANLPTPRVNQLKTLNLGDSQFIVRLPTGFNDEHTNVTGGTRIEQFVSPYSNEWDDLFAPLISVVTSNQKLPNLSRNAVAMLGTLGANGAASGYGANDFKSLGSSCQETLTPLSSVSRGGRGTTGVALTTPSHAQAFTPATRTLRSYYPAGNTQFGATNTFCSLWWPVVELIES